MINYRHIQINKTRGRYEAHIIYRGLYFGFVCDTDFGRLCNKIDKRIGR